MTLQAARRWLSLRRLFKTGELMQVPDEGFWRVQMPGPDPEEDLELILETVFDGEFGQVPSMYPVTIVQARYNGTYEGGIWLAFPVRPHELSAGNSPWDDWDSSDIECMNWWDQVRERGVPVGRSRTPDSALHDLLAQVAAAAAAGLTAELVTEAEADAE